MSDYKAILENCPLRDNHICMPEKGRCVYSDNMGKGTIHLCVSMNNAYRLGFNEGRRYDYEDVNKMIDDLLTSKKEKQK